jgi:hypothetical protein
MQHSVVRFCSIVLIGLVVYAALGPADWQLRPMLGWKTEHALGFFLVAFVTCVAWRRPVVGGAALAARAISLEILQAVTRTGIRISPPLSVAPAAP